MAAIGQYINQSEHDIYLLEELWMRPDYATIKERIPEGWFMTEYSEMTNGGCDGTVAPDGCSGLAVVSRYPFIEVCKPIFLNCFTETYFHTFQKSFTVYKDHGNAAHFWDGESLARKGVGRVRVEPSPGHLVDVFLTHTAASDYNDYYRQRQVQLNLVTQCHILILIIFNLTFY